MIEQGDDEGWMLFALALDGEGMATVLDEAAFREAWRDPGGRTVWIHLRRDRPEAQAWLRRESGFDELLCDRLLAEETRPGAEAVEDRLTANLRGVNLNPGAEPEDMVSLRLACEHQRLVTLRWKPLRAVQDVRGRLEVGRGPRGAIEVVHALADRLAERMHAVVMNLEEEVDALEIDLEENDSRLLASRRHQLSTVRRRAAQLRRFIAPQREALANAAECDLDWLKETTRRRLRDVRERTGRVLDDLDGVRERASVGFDEAVALQGERMNRTMYTLAIVAGVFLPLGFITGLLGINVGGMPGVENGAAFWVVCAGLAGLGIGVWLYFKRKGWM